MKEGEVSERVLPCLRDDGELQESPSKRNQRAGNNESRSSDGHFSLEDYKENAQD
jgi:hypothetical protein